MRQRIIPLRSENVSTFRISEAFTGFLLVCQIGKIQDCSVNISIFLLHGVVFLEIHTKSLFYALALMIILEQDFAFFRESLNGQTSVQIDISISDQVIPGVGSFF
jgi:hypothetical protein